MAIVGVKGLKQTDTDLGTKRQLILVGRINDAWIWLEDQQLATGLDRRSGHRYQQVHYLKQKRQEGKLSLR